MSGKEYQMMFKLSASLGKEFGGTMSSAQRALKQTQAEIKALNQQQSDIAAYNKQQTAIANTSRKLSDLQKEYDNIQREINETEGFSSSLNNKLIEKQRQIDKTTDSLNRETAGLDRMEQELREAGIDITDLTNESKKLDARLEELGEEANDFANEGANAFEVVGESIVAAGIAAALKEIAESYKECVEMSMEFGSTMSTVEALSGASKDEIEILSAEAKNLGATTAFTATESAEAMTYMAMAGWKTNQMLSGMEGVLNLAAASGEDLARTSDIVTDNLTAFGLSAKDTARFSDVLAAAATNSNTSVSIMGETFKNSAPLAGALGYTVEDVAVAVGLMANAGIKGERAGTALKNTFSGLLEEVELSGQAFGEVSYSVVNLDGSMKPFSDTIKDLRGYFNQMTAAEKMANAEALVGKEAMSGFVAMMNATDDDFNKLYTNINNCSGAAQKMADIKLDNLKGQMTLLSSATDALKTTIGGAFEDEFKGAASVLTDVVSGVNDFLARHPVLLKSMIAITAELGLVAGAYAAYNVAKKAGAALSAIKIALNIKEKATQDALNASILKNPYVLATAAVVGLTVAMVALSEATKNVDRETMGLTASSKDNYRQLQATKTEYEEACKTYGENSDQAVYLKMQVEGLTEAYESNKQTVEDYKSQQHALAEQLRDSVNANKDSTDEIKTNAAENQALITRLRELASQTTQTVESQQEMKSIINQLNQNVPGLALSYDDLINKVAILSDVDGYVKAQAEAKKYQNAQENIAQAYLDVQTAEQNHAKAVDEQTLAYERWQAAAEAYKGESQNWYGIQAAIMPFFSEKKKAMDDEYAAYMAATEAVGEHASALDDANSVYEGYKETLGGTTENLEAMGADYPILNEKILELNQSMTDLIAKYNEAYEAAYDSVSGQYAIWDEADDVVATSASSISQNLESQAQYWTDYNTNLENLSQRTTEIEGLSDVIASFADGTPESVNAIAGMASATDTELQAMVDNYNKLKEAQELASGSIADLKTNYTNQMNELVTNFGKAVDQLDLTDEGRIAGANTIQGFIDGAKGMESKVYSTYYNVALQAKKAVEDALDINSPSKVMFQEAVYTWQGYTEGSEAQKTAVEDTMAKNANAGIEAATTVLSNPTNATYSNPVSVSVAFNIDGSTGDVADTLNSYGETFAERVREVVEDIVADNSRRMYA